ncbi:MAG: diguanylate cyclase [Lachnospiraceae bacterium]|nr:diguanylate cyclase [Lachnospiraceae bacterium]
MYYSAIGVLAVLILLIENQDILLNRKGAFSKPSWRVYRCFLFTVLVYYITDILWGAIEARKMAKLLFADTSIYFIAMATGVYFWTKYVVTYLDEKNGFGRFLLCAGSTIAGLASLLSLVNIFTPVLFSVDEACVYTPLGVRYAVLISQIVLLLVISGYAFTSIIRRHKSGGEGQKYRTIALFGLIMAFILTAQIWFPYLPLYGIAYLLGTCLVRAFVIGDEKEQYRKELIEAEKIAKLKQTISALLNNMPALSFSKDAQTGTYLACNQAFAEYAHKSDPEGVIGLTDAEIFDPDTASHFVQDDQVALSMEEPYIFFEDVPDAVGNQRQFQTTKLKFVDDSGRLCTLGMCQDVTDMIRIQRENATTKEAYEKARSNSLIFTHIAQTLARGYEDLYYVNISTNEFIEYHTDEKTGSLTEIRRGNDFFEVAKSEAKSNVYPEDQASVESAMDKDTLIEALNKNKIFNMTYRLVTKAGPQYVNMTVSRMEDDDRFIIIGVTDFDDEMKRRSAIDRINEEHTAYSRMNALAGDFLCVYVVEPETGHYREFSSSNGFESLHLPKEGEDFFNATRELANNLVYPDDRHRFMAMFTRKGVMTEIESKGIFTLSYRLTINNKPNYVQLKAAMIDENEGRHLIVGINDIESQMRQEEDYAKRLAQAQNIANIDALTSVKNKHAYQDDEKKLDKRIREHGSVKFAIVILDINDLKKVNDTQGHQAGDQYIRDACKIICDIFKHSPVYRVGGDEFAVVVRGNDYQCIEELIGSVRDHNTEALRTGGIIIACGMARFDDDESAAAVFERADRNMYENKNSLKEVQKSFGQ